MPRRLRHFTYLDANMAESYLASLVGGIPEGGSTIERSLINEGGGWNLGTTGTGVHGGQTTDSASEEQENFRYTPEGIFNALYSELAKEEDGESILLSVEDMDQNRWADLRKGDVVELTGTIKLPEMLKAIDAANKLNELLPFLESLGDHLDHEFDFDEQEKSMVRGLGSLKDATESQDATVIILELANTPKYRFVGKLKKSYLRTNPIDLEGEVTLLATINRKLRKGDPPIGIEQLIPGLEAMMGIGNQPTAPPNRTSRRAKPNSVARPAKRKRQQEDSNADTTIGYPAATINTIAIY